MKIELNGKTAIITGSTSGIGYAIAKGLAEAGAHVIVNGRNAARVKRRKSSYAPMSRARTYRASPPISPQRRAWTNSRRRSMPPTFSSTISAYSNPSRSWKFQIPTGCAFSRPTF